MKKKYDVAVVIGRFQPFHTAHLELVTQALGLATNVVIVIGSHNSPRTIKNPWSSEDRVKMISDCFDESEKLRISFAGVEDSIYSNANWVSNVVSVVEDVVKRHGESSKIALVCHNKDETSFYIDMFKIWDIIDIGGIVTSTGGPELSASKIRELYFDGYVDILSSICPKPVLDFLKQFKLSNDFAEIKAEWDSALAYDKQYANMPYNQVNFVTVDSLVIQSGHVLLVKRKHAPGRGLWSLPGGHLNINETFIQGAIRELKEETNIKVPDKVLLGSLVYDEIFDHPDRSLRGRTKKKIGRTITRLFVFKLDDRENLPKVRGSDDASDAWFFTFGEIKNMRGQLFEDHWDIIQKGLSSL